MKEASQARYVLYSSDGFDSCVNQDSQFAVSPSPTEPDYQTVEGILPQEKLGEEGVPRTSNVPVYGQLGELQLDPHYVSPEAPLNGPLTEPVTTFTRRNLDKTLYRLLQ